MSRIGFAAVLNWLKDERAYQTKKFDYEVEAGKIEDPTYWLQQFSSYEQRIEVMGFDNPLGVQAALKLAATATALCEHLADRGQLPDPGYSSGEVHY